MAAVPTTMLAVFNTAIGELPAEVVETREIQVPEPGAGQVLAKVLMSPVHPGDLLTCQGKYPLNKVGKVMGAEGVGAVVKVGDGVAESIIGKRVLLANSVGGNWCEYVLVNQGGGLIEVPDTVSTESAAQFVANPMTAWLITTHYCNAQPGEWMAVTAGGSAVALVVHQLAKHMGFHTIAVVRRQEHADALLGEGVCKAAIVSATDDITARAMDITGESKLSYIVDCTGGPDVSALLEACAHRAKLVVYGQLAGASPVSNSVLVAKMIQVLPFNLMDEFTKPDKSLVLSQFGPLMEAFSAGVIRLAAGAKFSLADCSAALTDAGTSGKQGKTMFDTSLSSSLADR